MSHSRLKPLGAALKKLLAALIAIALAVALVPALEPGARAASNGMIRVKLSQLGSRASISFKTTTAYYINGNTNQKIASGQSATVSISGASLLLTVGGVSANLGSSFVLARGQSGLSGVQFTSPSLSNLFCGDLKFSISSSVILPVLNIYVEDYLLGVVAYEMSNSWPLEALKAQAVAARNYALRCKGSRSSSAYDVTDTSTDQVFKGYNSSYSRVAQAVKETAGMALYYGSALAACYYTASNGGQTESTKNIWGGSLAYSIVKDDPYDLQNASSTKKTASLRKDAIGLNASLVAALKSGMASQLSAKGLSASAGDIAITRIASIEPHTPVYAAPSRLFKKLKFTLDATSRNTAGQSVSATVSVDVDTTARSRAVFARHQHKENETVWVEQTDRRSTSCSGLGPRAG